MNRIWNKTHLLRGSLVTAPALVLLSAVAFSVVWAQISQSQAEERLGARIADSPTASGVLVREVAPDRAADKAGLMDRDLILRFQGTHVKNLPHFSELVLSAPEGDRLEVEVLRGPQIERLAVVFSSPSSSSAAADVAPTRPDFGVMIVTKSGEFPYREGQEAVHVTVGPNYPLQPIQLKVIKGLQNISSDFDAIPVNKFVICKGSGTDLILCAPMNTSRGEWDTVVLRARSPANRDIQVHFRIAWLGQPPPSAAASQTQPSVPVIVIVPLGATYFPQGGAKPSAATTPSKPVVKGPFPVAPSKKPTWKWKPPPSQPPVVKAPPPVPPKQPTWQWKPPPSQPPVVKAPPPVPPKQPIWQWKPPSLQSKGAASSINIPGLQPPPAGVPPIQVPSQPSGGQQPPLIQIQEEQPSIMQPQLQDPSALQPLQLQK